MKLAEILSGPETWIQGAFFREGKACLVGALAFLHGEPIVEGSPYSLDFRKELDRMRQVIPFHGDLAYWNDNLAKWDDVASAVDAYDRDRLLNP